MAERIMSFADIGITVVAVGAAVVMKEQQIAPDWVSHALAAFTGSGLSAGFRWLQGDFKGFWSAGFTFISGAIGAFYAADMIVNLFGLEHEVEIPLIFFMAVVMSKVIRAGATRLEVDAAVDALGDKLTGRLKKK